MMDDSDSTWGTIRHYIVSFLILAGLIAVGAVLACVVCERERIKP